MTTNKRITITSVFLGVALLVFIIFIISPLFDEIKKESQNLIAQKKILAELGIKSKNLKEFQATYENYQPDLEKIDKLFIDPTEPIEFIEFLEKEAATSQLFIEIAPLLPKKMKGGVWPHMDFQLTLIGFFPDFLKFFEKVESSPYLIEISNLSLRKLDEEILGQIGASLLIKVYTK